MNDTAPAYAQALDQLRAERDDLRAQLEAVTAERDTARAELDGTRSRLTMTTRDLDAAERAVVKLKAIAHAIVNAVAKETP